MKINRLQVSSLREGFFSRRSNDDLFTRPVNGRRSEGPLSLYSQGSVLRLKILHHIQNDSRKHPLHDVNKKLRDNKLNFTIFDYSLFRTKNWK